MKPKTFNDLATTTSIVVTTMATTASQLKIITKNPVTSSSYGNGPNYEIVFNDANAYDYFEFDVSQLDYKSSQGVWIGFSKFETTVHESVELLAILGAWQGTRSIISYRIPSNAHINGDCGYCVVQKSHSFKGWRSGLSVKITDGEIDIKSNGKPLLNHKSSFIKKSDFKCLVVGTKNGTGGKWTIKAVKT